MNTPKEPILLVDDEAHLLASFETLLNEQGITHTVTCNDSRDVEALLTSHTFGAIVMDLDMPHISGQELLPLIAAQQPDAVILIVTGAADIEMAVTCMQQGASDYILKPVDASRLVASVRNAIDVYALRRENMRLKHHFLSPELERPDAFHDIVTRNAAMRAILKYVEAISDSAQGVLITGETGCGKELVARAVHALSGRQGEFVAVNVAGLDDVMFSDTLFGHVKGAFTGADTKRAGMVEAANGGTLFLDEIGDLAPASQVKLLRLLQEQEFLPLGSDRAMQSDARVIAATNLDVNTLKTGTHMRRDLYYRLAVHNVCIPPLRERLDDIPLLVHHFVETICEQLDKPAPAVEDGVELTLQRQRYPGNVREFEAMMHDVLSTHKGDTLNVQDFSNYMSPAAGVETPAHDAPHTDGSPATASMGCVFPDPLPTSEEALQSLVEEAMRRADNNQTAAAKSIGISRQTLNKKWGEMRKHTHGE